MRRFVPPFVVLLALLAFASAASGAARLYAVEYSENKVWGLDRNADGSLTQFGGSPFTVVAPGASSAGPIGFGFVPDGSRVVANFLFKGTAQGFSLSPDGTLATAGAPIAGATSEGLAVSPDGRFAYVGTRDFGGVKEEGLRAFAIGPDGALTPIGAVPKMESVGDLAMTPNGRFLFAKQGAGIGRYAIGSDGSLTELEGVATAGTRYLSISPDGRFLFTLQTSPGSIASYAIGAEGGLKPVGMPLLTGNTSPDLFAVSADGARLYVPEPGTKQILAIAVGADGALSAAGSMPAENPRVAAISPDGRYLYWTSGGGEKEEEGIHVAAIGADRVPVPLPFATVPIDAVEPVRIAFQPNPAPVASLTAKAAAPGAATNFNATKSTNAARFDWSFGDGTALANGGPTPTHAYAAAGRYTVTLSLTDAQGCGAKQIYTGQTTTCPGGSATTTTAVVDTLPVIGKVKAAPKKFLPVGVVKGKGGTKFRVKLNEAAKIGLKIERRLPGRKVGKKCKKPTPGNASKKKCNRFIKLGSRSKAGKAGWTAIAFNGKLKGKPLAPGGYRVTAVATDSAKGRSAPRTAAFRILGY